MTQTQEDPRWQNLVTIDGGPRLVVGVPPGGADAALNRSAAAVAKAMTTLRTRAAEIRGHSQLLPSEQGRRIDELRPAALEAARGHLQVQATEAARIDHLAATASPVRTSAQVPGHVLLEDQIMVARFGAMSISEKTQIVAKAMADPAANQRWAECLLRWPAECTGADPAMLRQLHDAAMEVFQPELQASIQAQQDQVEFGQRAMSLTEQVLAETLPGALQELRSGPEPVSEAAPAYEIPRHVLHDLMTGGVNRPAQIERQRT